VGTTKATLIAFVVGAVLGAGITGYIAWQQLRDAREDMAETRSDLDRARTNQREAERSARRLADELEGTRSALRDSRETVSRLRKRVSDLRTTIADSGEQIDALGGSLGAAVKEAQREQELIKELRGVIERGRAGAEKSTP